MTLETDLVVGPLNQGWHNRKRKSRYNMARLVKQ